MEDFDSSAPLPPADTALPPPDDDKAPPDTASEGAVGPQMAVTIGTSSATQTTIANVLNQYFDDPADTLTFSPDMAAPLSREFTQELEALVVVDEDWTAKILQQLEERRVILLTGDRGSGKACIAKYLATRVAETHRLHKSLVVGPLERRRRILLRKVADEQASFGGRVTVFTDAFAHRNADLTAFFTADRAAWDQLCATLHRHDAYWIFTSANVDLHPIRAKLSAGVACHELPAAPKHRIAPGIDKKLQWDAGKHAARGERLEILAANRDRLIRELRTIPRIYAFIDDFIREDVDLDRALERFDKASMWFARELASDVDAWCFALTLTLTRPTPDSPPVAWSDFEHLRRSITERIKSDTEIFPRRKFRDVQHGDSVFEQTSGAALTDDALLERCRAVVRKDVYGLRDVVTFEDTSRGDELWETLLCHNRRVLSAIAPLLKRMAESQAESMSLRITAAQIIGRIGSVDAAAISLPLIRREWLGGKDGVILSSLIGRLVQGVLASGIDKYQHAALHALGELAAVSPKELDESGRDRLVTAIAAYSQLGDYPMAATMEHLGDIAIEHCAPSMAEMHQMFMLAEKADRDRAASTSGRRAERLRARGRGLARRARQVLAQQAPILAALEEALVYLAVMNDAVQTLTETRDWISRGGSSTGMVVTLLFLHEGGIADRLEGFALEADSELGRTSIGPLLLAAASSRESAGALAGFLADLHGSINTMFAMPADVQQRFRERFDECLTSWARGAVGSSLFREVLEDLFVTLASVRAGAMRRDIFMLLDTAAFREEAAMSSFAIGVRKRIG